MCSPLYKQPQKLFPKSCPRWTAVDGAGALQVQSGARTRALCPPPRPSRSPYFAGRRLSSKAMQLGDGGRVGRLYPDISSRNGGHPLPSCLFLRASWAQPRLGKHTLQGARRDSDFAITRAGSWGPGCSRARVRTINDRDPALRPGEGPAGAGCLHARPSVWGLQIRVRC